jgi:hypothetical protein
MEPLMRYEMRETENGWCVWDCEKNTPVVVDGRWASGLSMEAAFELARVLNIYGYKPPAPP